MEHVEKIALAIALSYASKQVTNNTEKRLLIQEFWHSLNRKHLVENSEVKTLITITLTL